MYDVVPDPYCYRNTTVLKNRAGLRDQPALDAFEAISTAQRAEEPLPAGRYSVRHYRRIHHHLFQDVYPWAGRFRTVRLSKGLSAFCYPEFIGQQMKALFARLRREHCLRGLTRAAFIQQSAAFLTTLNAIHPFREGNGRAQMTFLTLLAHDAGHPFKLGKLEPERFLRAMVVSFGGNEAFLRREIGRLVPRL